MSGNENQIDGDSSGDNAVDKTLSSKHGTVTVMPVQGLKIQRIEALIPISSADYHVLDEIREVLLRHGYQTRFGVC